jgi:adenylate cyclase
MEQESGFRKSNVLKSVENYVTRRWSQEKPPELLFHTLEHSREVVENAGEIGKAEGLDDETLENVIIAAWFHDLGYLKTYIGHEEESQTMATRFLRELQLDEDRIQQVRDIIIATKFGHVPKNLAESVIIDADRLHIAGPGFWEKGDKLRTEWTSYLEKRYSEREWAETQLKHLENTTFFCEYSRTAYGAEREKNIKRASTLLEAWLHSEQNFARTSFRTVFRIWQNTRSALAMMGLGLILGTGLSVSVWGIKPEIIPAGLLSGAFIGLTLYFFDPIFEKKVLRKFSFPIGLLTGTLALVVLFVGSPAAALQVLPYFILTAPFSGQVAREAYLELLTIESLVNLGWLALLTSVILNFIKLATRIIGPRMLQDYLRGKYFKPQEEERIFMFLDLNSSTRLAETMNIGTYHQLLAGFFRDIAGPIARSRGQIYQYVGDEVVVSWPMKEGLRDSTCLRCFFRIEKQMEKLRPIYEQKFGFLPDYKVAFHGGKVIAGEVGKYKTDIVFHGPVLNTTERILNLCKPLKSKVLISENLLRRIDLLPNLAPTYISSIQLQGSDNEISLYTLKRKE